MEKINDTYLPKEALITKKTVTTNTKENRFLKFMLLKIIGKIDKFILKLKKLNNNDAEILERLLSYKKEINKINDEKIEEIVQDLAKGLSEQYGKGYGKKIYLEWLNFMKRFEIIKL